jgi:hypothetical protein
MARPQTGYRPYRPVKNRPPKPPKPKPKPKPKPPKDPVRKFKRPATPNTGRRRDADRDLGTDHPLDDAPAEYTPNWMMRLDKPDLQQVLREQLGLLREFYPLADPSLLDRLVWIGRIMDRMEQLFVASALKRGGEQALRRRVALYLDAAEVVIQLLRAAEQQHKRRARENPKAVPRGTEPPWRMPVVLED